jgi:peptidoglycan/LPS O-acetylase OafA/YrhL
MGKHIYLEALRGLTALLVVLAHFLAAFYPSTIFGAQYRAHEPWEIWFTTTPLGLAGAGPFAVCLFFILSGYVLSVQYLGAAARDTDHLLASIFKRPVRLVGLVVTSELIAFALLRASAYFNKPVSELSYSIPWFQGFWSQGALGVRPFLLEIATGPFAAGTHYNPPLWSIQSELYGSFLVFALLLFFRATPLRWAVYAGVMLFFSYELYQGFIIGVMLADLSRNHAGLVHKCSRDFIAYPLLVAGLILGSYPRFVDQAAVVATFYGRLPDLWRLGGGYSMFGAALVLAAVLISPSLQQFLTKPVFAFLGRISYALYVAHFLILGSLSSWLFLHLLPGLGYHRAFLVAGLVSLGALLAVSQLLTRYVDQPVTRGANRLAAWWLRRNKSSPRADFHSP